MNVYDFDGTIYDGDSSRDFYRFCLKKQARLALLLPKQLFFITAFYGGIKDKTYCKERIFSFIARLDDVDSLVDEFCRQNITKIKPWYLQQKRDDDIIISASPEFLLRPFCDELGIKHLIGSKIDRRTGVFDGKNCHDEEKVLRLEQYMPRYQIDRFYSDSLSDVYLARLAGEAFMVKGDKLSPWPPESLQSF